jgi:hypothetical protein
MGSRPNLRVGVVVAPALVRRVKVACDKAGVFDRAVGVQKDVTLDNGSTVFVPTTLDVSGSWTAAVSHCSDLNKLIPEQEEFPFDKLPSLVSPRLEDLSVTLLSDLNDVVESLRLCILPAARVPTISPTAASPFSRALSQVARSSSSPDRISTETLSAVSSSIPRWEQYGTFVLFQPGAFDSPQWHRLLDVAPSFFETLARTLGGATHLAVRAPISRGDVMRRPRICPIFGTFSKKMDGDDDGGFFPETPTEDDFGGVFWAEAGIDASRADGGRVVLRYVWAPSYVGPPLFLIFPVDAIC